MERTARMASRSWLITGASNGLGNAFARAALGAGDLVTATACRPEALAGLTRRFPGRVTAVALDVRDAGQCQRAVGTALGAHGRIDVLVNNAGHGIVGAVEETTEEELRDAARTAPPRAPWPARADAGPGARHQVREPSA